MHINVAELEEKSGLGIFALSAIIVDKAEPSEASKNQCSLVTRARKPTPIYYLLYN